MQCTHHIWRELTNTVAHSNLTLKLAASNIHMTVTFCITLHATQASRGTVKASTRCTDLQRANFSKIFAQLTCIANLAIKICNRGNTNFHKLVHKNTIMYCLKLLCTIQSDKSMRKKLPSNDLDRPCQCGG